MKSSTIKSLLKASVFAIVGFVVLFLVYRSNNAAYQEDCALKGIPAADCNLLEKVVSDVASANYWWVLLSLFLFMVSNVSRAMRWHIVLEPMGYKPKFINSISSIMVAYLSNLGIPRSGEFVRAGTLAKYEGYPFEKLMGTIILDRIADVISLLIAIGLAIVLSYNTFFKYLRENEMIAARLDSLLDPVVLISLAAVGTLFLYFIYKNKESIVRTKIGGKIAKLLLGFKEGILSITKLRRPWAFLFHSVLIWVCYFLMTYVIFFAFEPTAHLGPVQGLVIFVFGTLGIVFPSPGGMGSYHFLVEEGLSLYGIAAADAFSFANIMFFSVQLFCNVFFGILALIILPIYNKES